MSQQPPYTEQELLTQLKAGDAHAFTRLYHMYSKQLYLTIFRLVKSDKIAEELLQELFVKLWEKRGGLTIQSNIGGYLNRMGANLVFDFYRKATKDQLAKEQLIAFFSDEQTDHQPAQELETEADTVNQLVTLMEQLPPQRKKVFELCKIQGKSYQEAGQQLGISVSTVNDHIVKATRLLRTQLIERNSFSALLLLLLLTGSPTF
ncbi:MAG TPA: RNA polymerase sigma-70 factor [Arachidicoccus sp.]|nr:RNA polymerase sigma-70 factor [Arachidicoccus sp.]